MISFKTALKLLVCLAAAVLVTGCAAPKAAHVDYTAFKQSKPRSILVLPPLNESPDVGATYSVFSQLTYPLAESGYYVMPVALVNETFKQNGLSGAADIHNVSPAKLREIFGADAALYVTIKKYGSSYTVVDSVVTVSASAKLVDLKTGDVLWTGSASASNNENGNNTGGGIIGILVTAAIKQIINNISDASYPVAGFASQRLLFAGRPNGMLFGPHSPRYGTD